MPPGRRTGGMGRSGSEPGRRSPSSNAQSRRLARRAGISGRQIRGAAQVIAGGGVDFVLGWVLASFGDHARANGSSTDPSPKQS
jgi:hypothetical protein